MINRTKISRIFPGAAMFALLALAMLSGCGGHGGGVASQAPAAKASGNGKVAAMVKLTPPAARLAGATGFSTMTVSISITGVYALDDKEFTPVTATAVIDFSNGPAKVSVLSVPVGTNHLLTVVADWGSETQTVKAIIPVVAEGELASVTVDPESTVIANTALYIAEQQKKRLADLDTKDIAQIEAAVALMAANGSSVSAITPEQVLAYMAGMGIPAGITVTPATATVMAGQTYQFTGAMLDRNSTPISGATATWSFSAANVGTVSANGLFTASLAGSGVLTAANGSFTATASVTVISTCTQNSQCEDGSALTLDACTNPGTSSSACAHTAIACNTSSDCGGGSPVCVGGGTANAACIVCASTPDCNDNNALTIDSCSSAGTANSACGHVTIACNTTADCNDNNALTIDACSNGGTAQSSCGHAAMACNTSADCGGGSPICVSGGGIASACVACATSADCDDANSNTTDTCNNPGTPNASCSHVNNAPTSAGISIGDDHACALQSDGAVKCWGYNSNGATGNGISGGGGGLPRRAGARTAGGRIAARQARSSARGSAATSAAPRPASRAAAVTNGGNAYDLDPVTVVGLTGATQVTAKGTHSCALLSGGAVKCWGENNNGQLGDGTTNNSNVPVAVSGLTGAVQIDNYYHTCAVINDGSVKCWGYNSNGQLGDGTNNNSNVPVTVSGLSGSAVQVAVADYHTCALISGGTVQCWGYGGEGELGDGLGADSLTPVTVSGLTGVTAISAGDEHTCAITGGALKCWGYNGSGQLGDGTTNNSNAPVAVSGLTSGVTAVAAGYEHTCALLSGGQARCWGYNNYGELGASVTAIWNDNNLLPLAVTDVSGTITGVAAGDSSTCFMISGGTFKCLGFNVDGQLGNGRGYFNTAPVSEFGLTGIADVSFSSYSVCALKNGNSISCWGDNSNGQFGGGTSVPSINAAAPSGFTSPIGVAVGSDHVCAIINGGTVQCSGYGGNGQLGNGSNTSSNVPVTVSGLSGVTKLASGGSSTCALVNDGTVKCWGYNYYGELGDGTNTNSSVPVSVSGLTGATDIHMGYANVCALINDGSVKCWGNDSSGQLGNTSCCNSSNVPVDVNGLTGATAISVDSNSVCALVSGGAMKCWGWNGYGGLGDGTTSNSTVPVDVVGLTGATEIGVSGGAACALMSDGTVKCWGWNNAGKLGNDSGENSLTPVTVSGITDATALYAGEQRICAYSTSKGLYCWGYDPYWYWWND